jgi:hypothetical protein
MKDYCCQIISTSGRVLEKFYEDFFDAVRECTSAAQGGNAVKSQVFRYPDMNTPICVARLVK